MSPLPQAVQRDAVEADRLQTQIVGTRAAQQSGDGPGIAGAHHVAATNNQSPAGDLPADQTLEYWKNRFTSMKSYHDDVVPKLRQENAQLRAELEQSKRGGTTPGAGTQAQPRPGLTLSEEETESIGAENVETIQRMVAHQIGSVQETVSNQFEQERELQRRKLWSQFESELASLVPNYLAIDKTPNWKHYLGAVIDQGSGQSMQQMLDNASNAFNARGAAAIFGDFQRAQTSGVSSYAPGIPIYFPQPQQQHAQQPFQQPQLHHQQPANGVNPAMARTPSAPVDGGAEIEIWDRSEIDTFWEDYRKFVSSQGNKDPRKAAEYEETVQRIQLAENEGRVDNSR